jgi:phospholipid/cholesterol/gamma-HCH transport system ATP-binding protein
LKAITVRTGVMDVGDVALVGFEDYFPAQISGGMQKRAGLARAMRQARALALSGLSRVGSSPMR